MSNEYAFEDEEPRSRRVLWAPKRHTYNRCIPRKEVGGARKKLVYDAKLVVQSQEKKSIDALGVRPVDLLAEKETVHHETADAAHGF